MIVVCIVIYSDFINEKLIKIFYMIFLLIIWFFLDLIKIIIIWKNSKVNF